jgi:hypothetical protein
VLENERSEPAVVRTRFGHVLLQLRQSNSYSVSS